jgi:hypothetical protein
MATYSNTLGNFTPEHWSKMIQENLYKKLVAMDVADTKWKEYLTNGDTVHFPIFGQLTVTAYTKGTDVTVQPLATTDETLLVDKLYESSAYLDDVNKKQSMYQTMSEIIKEESYAVRNQVDQDVLAEVLNAHDSVDDGDIGGTAGNAIALTTTNVIQVFSTATRKLAENDVHNNGDFCAVVSPAVASIIEQKATGVGGFNLADSSFKNGYAGDFMGYKIYVSNNLDSTTDSRTHCYIGKKKMIALGMQMNPKVDITPDPLKFGDIIKMLAVYGVKTFTKRGERFLDMQVTVA